MRVIRAENIMATTINVENILCGTITSPKAKRTGGLRPSLGMSAEEAAEAFKNAFALHSGRTDIKYLDCRGCGNEVELLDNTGQCEWCGRRYAEEGDNGRC